MILRDAYHLLVLSGVEGPGFCFPAAQPPPGNSPSASRPQPDPAPGHDFRMPTICIGAQHDVRPGTLRKASKEHLEHYCHESSFGFNRRGNQEQLFADTKENPLRGKALSYETLKASEISAS